MSVKWWLGTTFQTIAIACLYVASWLFFPELASWRRAAGCALYLIGLSAFLESQKHHAD